jgi:hypothetical protein
MLGTHITAALFQCTARITGAAFAFWTRAEKWYSGAAVASLLAG